MAQLVNVIAPIFTNENGLFLQTSYYPLQLFANSTKGKALELFVDSPKYKSRRFDDIPYVDASAGYENGSLTRNVVNRHPDQAIATEFELEDKLFSGPADPRKSMAPTSRPRTILMVWRLSRFRARRPHKARRCATASRHIHIR
jgi:alpha-N-arabinofuranosidase